MRRSRCALAIVLASCVSFCASSIAATNDYAGLYVRIDTNYKLKSKEFDAALGKSFVDGAAIVVQWASVEPQKDQFDFSLLDRWVKDSVEKHKKISFALMAGWFTPHWLYDEGAQKVSIRLNRNPQNVGGPVCSELTMPVPWDEKFVQAYNHATDKIAKHLRGLSIPGADAGAAYQAVKIVKLSGINNTTEELRLPAGKGGVGPCDPSDAQAIWADAGFTPDKIISAWTKISDATAAAFPDAILSIATIQVGAFPPIDDDGQIYRPTPGKTDALTDKIIHLALKKYGHSLAVQWNGLSQQKPNPAVLAAGRRGAIVGWQLNQSLGPAAGTGCFYGEIGHGQIRVKCKSHNDFAQIVDQGINLNGRFIEIWAPNLDEYGEIFKDASKKLNKLH